MGGALDKVGALAGGGVGGLLTLEAGKKVEKALYGNGAPDGPDYLALANQTTLANRPNEYTPWGSQEWTQNADGSWASNFNLSGDAGSALQNLQSSMLASSSYDPASARQQAIDSNYSQAKSRLDTDWGQNSAAFQAQMANSGLDPGTEAYNNAFTNMSQAKNDAYSTALANAISQGNETQQTQMNQSMLPYTQYGSLINSSLQQPSVGPASDLTSAGQAGYQADLNSYNVDQANKQDMISGITSLGTKAAGKGKAALPPALYIAYTLLA
jgi:hypothetical protein